MSFIGRLWLTGLAAAAGLFLLDEDRRNLTGHAVSEAYAYVAGSSAPLPLARPPHLALAALDDCLRGNARIEGDDAYAAYCTDLSNLGGLPGKAAPEGIRHPFCNLARMDGLLPVAGGCRVASPATGTILYAGSFKGYLGVVIVEADEGDRITLAGLAAIAVERGARIAEGEELGAAPRKTAPALAGAADGQMPALLILTKEGALEPSS